MPLRSCCELSEEGPRCRRQGPRDSHESAVGRQEQLADEGRSDYGTDDYATAGSGLTRQSEARDSEIAASQSTRYVLGIYYLPSD